MNLHQKLIEVRKEVSKLRRDTEGYGYKYVSGSQVLEKIRPKMDELGILLVPSIVPSTFSYVPQRHEEVDKWGKTKTVKDVFVTAEMLMSWINADDPSDKLEVPFMLCGQQDDVSQSFGSGLTYSERYFMLKFFNIPTDDDDPDKKNSSKKADDKAGDPPASNKGNSQGNGQTDAKLVSEGQIKRLYAIAKDKGIAKAAVDKKVMTENKKTVDQLTIKECNALITRIEKAEVKPKNTEGAE